MTDSALVRLGARVYTHVLVEDRPLPEVTAAEHALVRLLVGMDPDVLRQVGLLPEPKQSVSSRSCVSSHQFKKYLFMFCTLNNK